MWSKEAQHSLFAAEGRRHEVRSQLRSDVWPIGDGPVRQSGREKSY
jgi:hypothetical protein